MNEFKTLFEKSFHQYHDGLCRYAFTFLRDIDKSKDAVQSVFVKWWEKRDEIKIAVSIKSYLFKALHHQCLNTIRNEKIVRNFKEAYNKSMVLDFVDPISFQETDLKIKQTLEGLPPQCRLIFHKSRFEEKTYSQIATELNISPRTVEVQISKALKSFREKVLS